VYTSVETLSVTASNVFIAAVIQILSNKQWSNVECRCVCNPSWR